MYLYRIHIRPQGGEANIQTTFNYCLSNGLLGVGWRTETNRNTKVWDEYFDEASKLHNNLQNCAYIHKRIKEGDLVWTRDGQAQYYIARVKSGWEYWQSQEAVDFDIDIANIFRCDFQRVVKDAVPGKVIACFRAPKSVQSIADNATIEYSKYLWNKLARCHAYTIDQSKFPDIFTMLDDEETEDLLFLYLQTLGWHIVPNSRKADTMRFEFFLVNPVTGDRADVQVKTGNERLNSDTYGQHSNQVFLFQSNEYYDGSTYDNVTCISQAELVRFMRRAINWLPSSFKIKLELVRQD